jgi:hypothetical protein
MHTAIPLDHRKCPPEHHSILLANASPACYGTTAPSLRRALEHKCLRYPTKHTASCSMAYSQAISQGTPPRQLCQVVMLRATPSPCTATQLAHSQPPAAHSARQPPMDAKCVVCCTAGSSHASREAHQAWTAQNCLRTTIRPPDSQRHVHAKEMTHKHTVKGVPCTHISANCIS